MVTELWLVRHGESVANLAASAAELTGEEVIRVEFRDADVPLSPIGIEQAKALGNWLADRVTDATAPTVWVSPYLRARQTAAFALEGAGLSLTPRIDERLRDRELGVLDLLTSIGVEQRLPNEAARRRWLGKFYYRPPGGESWADLALRIRSVLRDLEGDRVLIVAHDAVVMLFLYVCLGLTEESLLDFAQHNTVANASITRLSFSGDVWSLDEFSHADHLRASDVPVTEHPGDKDADIH